VSYVSTLSPESGEQDKILKLRLKFRTFILTNQITPELMPPDSSL
jgi:hypothetical protein